MWRRLTAMAVLSGSLCQTQAETVGPWDLGRLRQVPKVTPTAECQQDGFESFFYDGLAWKGKPTRVFAYYRAPDGEVPAGGWPGVVCVHGGGGTAFPEWVQKWNDHGYAAIAMDLEGHLPDRTLPHDTRPAFDGSGPQRVGQWQDDSEPVEDQWFYHAVAQVVLAHSLFRIRPEVNPDEIGVNGISWGGIITSVVAGVDTRFKFAVPVYGCGFLHESDGVLTFDGIPEENRRKSIADWEPSNYLPRATLPMLWVNGTNDKHFPLDVWYRSAASTDGPHTLRAGIRMRHGHGPGWSPEEIYAFADSVLRDGKPLARIEEVVRKDRGISAGVTSPTSVTKAELCYTEDLGTREHRYWQSTPATVTGNTVAATLPKHATCFFVNMTDERGFMVSSSYHELPDDEVVRAPVAPSKETIDFAGLFQASAKPGDGVRVVRAETFESLSVGDALAGTVVEDAAGNAGIRVTDDNAANGAKALRITDSATCKHAWMPSLQTWFRAKDTVRSGRCTIAFDIRQPTEKAVSLTLMVRDYEATPYHEALTLTCGANGMLKFGNKTVGVRPGVWHHVSIGFAIGADSRSPAQFSIHTADQPEETFNVPLRGQKLDSLGWIGFCAGGRGEGSCSIDNLVIRLASETQEAVRENAEGD